MTNVRRGLVTFVAAAAGGTHTQSFTQNFHGTQTATVQNPCTGELVDLTVMTNSVFHDTFFPASDELWVTFTESDSFTGVGETSGTTYSGHNMNWFNANLNNQNANFTFTSALHVTGSDGSMITMTEVGHVTLLPDGSVAVSFDKPRLTCS